MKYRSISIALSAAVLALGAMTAIAADTKAVAPAPAASSPAASPSKAVVRRNELDAKRKALAKVKVVDINSATKKELMKLPGISDAEATMIIAGRPYGSKIWLVTHKILPADKYQAISALIAAKNAALYIKNK